MATPPLHVLRGCGKEPACPRHLTIGWAHQSSLRIKALSAASARRKIGFTTRKWKAALVGSRGGRRRGSWCGLLGASKGVDVPRDFGRARPSRKRRDETD
eukprot:6203537-Pleurochrysis_carterae.AAC.3